jgi:hypothetical protein
MYIGILSLDREIYMKQLVNLNVSFSNTMSERSLVADRETLLHEKMRREKRVCCASSRDQNLARQELRVHQRAVSSRSSSKGETDLGEGTGEVVDGYRIETEESN